jgi:DNA-binding GntR family transcriptional regulator
VLAKIQDMILSGELPPGTRLIETDLAERFGTSRGPVRTALMELDRKGLVVQNARRGTFVADLTDDDVEEIISLWEALWTLAVRRAVERITPEDIEELRESVPPPPEDVDIEEVAQSNLDFQHRIVELAAHSRLLEIWDNVTTQRKFRLMTVAAAEKRQLFRLNPSTDIFKALEKRDAEEAIRVSAIAGHFVGRIVVSSHNAPADGTAPPAAD